MKHRIAVALVLPVALLSCATGGAPARQAPAPQATPLLWRAEPGGGGGPLFLFGSIHVATPTSFEMSGAVGDAWEDSDELVVEVDLTQISVQDAAGAAMRYGMLPEGETLEQRIGTANWEALVQRLRAKGLPAMAFERLEPWLAALTLQSLQFQEAGLDPEFGVDKQVLSHASGEKPIVELEGFESQLAMLDSLSPEVQRLMLEESLARYDEAVAESAKIHESWRRGDEEALVDLFFGHVEESPEYALLYDKFFYERNETMTERLVELSRDGKTRFTVLGAGHMVGPRGIPQLLAERGFKVERVP